MSDHDDQRFERMLRADPRMAVVELVERHADFVRRVLAGDLRVAPGDAVLDDVIGEATCNVLRFAQTYRASVGSVRAWFLVIARRCANRMLGHRRELVSTAVVARSVAESGRPEGDALERIVILYDCIDALPRRQREVVLEDLSHSLGAGDRGDNVTLASRLGVTPNAIAAARRRARSSLRTCIERKLPDGEFGGFAG